MDSQMTLRKKLTLLGALLIGLTIILGSISLVGLNGYQQAVTSLAGDALAGLSSCSKTEAAFLELRGDTWRHVSSNDPRDKDRLEQEIARLKGEIGTGIKEMQATIFSDEERESIQKIDPALQRYYELWAKVAALSSGGKREQAQAYKQLVQGSPIVEEVKNSIRAETEHKRRNGQKFAAEAATTGARLRWLTWVFLLLAISLGAGALYLFVRSLTALLRHTVSELTEGAGQVASASAQVASSSQALAQGSSQQAASLEETSASSEEINSMTQKNAESSATAATLMTDVDRRVGEGNQTLAEMMQSMQEITGSSDKISKIIKVIDEIAFQTNILALNAAVEAARAGEAGMGFAVVADEVRSLAQRSAQAAKDTSALIEESIAKSSQGSTRLQRVGDVMRAITESTAKVKTLVDEVNLGSQEQARGIQQISRAIAQMEQVTQGTAASAEESASASEQLSAQAEAMKQALRRLSRLVDGGQDSGAGDGARQSIAKRPLAAWKPQLPGHTAPKAIKPAVSFALSKPPARKLIAMTESPTDAQFLESFEEM
jgi:methyl-accepting chemotaxis protein/methyl-accepting chemotaxis protein-1 (serine sensor receptor)